MSDNPTPEDPKRPGGWVTFDEAIKATIAARPDDRIYEYAEHKAGHGLVRVAVCVTSDGRALALRRSVPVFGSWDLAWVPMDLTHVSAADGRRTPEPDGSADLVERLTAMVQRIDWRCQEVPIRNLLAEAATTLNAQAGTR